MAQRHHLTFPGEGGDLELRRQGFFDDERVIAGRLEGAGNALEEAGAVVVDGGGLAVHQARGPYHTPTQRIDDTLVAEADAQDRLAQAQAPDERVRDAGLRGGARSRRDYDMAGIQRLQLIHRDGVIAVSYTHLRAH